MNEYYFIKSELENGEKLYLNLMKITVCIVKENFIEVTMIDGNTYALNKKVCSKLLEELEFWSANDEQVENL